MTDTITLGGRALQLRPLKLGQLRVLLDALDGMAGKSGGALVEAAAAVVAAGLAPAHPDLTPEAVLEFEATLDELSAVVAAVLRAAGLNPVGEAGPMGEAGPVATAPEGTSALLARSSAPSMGPSPPAAALRTR